MAGRAADCPAAPPVLDSQTSFSPGPVPLPAVSHRPRLLVVGPADALTEAFPEGLPDTVEAVRPGGFEHGLRQLRDEAFDGVLLCGSELVTPGCLIEPGGVLDQIPDGVVLLDGDRRVLWANAAYRDFVSDAPADEPASRDSAAHDGFELVGAPFYDTMAGLEIIGPDFNPLNTAVALNRSVRTTVRLPRRGFMELHVRPVRPGGFSNAGDDTDAPPARFLAVTVRDVSVEVRQRQKLAAIYRAGMELGDLRPDELPEMSLEDRVELLKGKILQFSRDLLEFDTIEIRLLDPSREWLTPLLSVGMGEGVAERALRAEPVGNGSTGFVASTGKSYICEDTRDDPLYLPGAPGARSSLTVPLVRQDEVIGTLNVESDRVEAFDQNDLAFVELFAREVAHAVNTLDLLVAEKAQTASESTDRTLREVAGPVDEILNDAAWLLERHAGQDGEVAERIRRLLAGTRDIKAMIQRVGDELTPENSRGAGSAAVGRSRCFRGRRVLVADGDPEVRQDAHRLLGGLGCQVETAHDGAEALLMARSVDYDAVLMDIRLPDMNGYTCFHDMRGTSPELPILFTAGFGYDANHSIVKARREGLNGVLFKPFKPNQVNAELERAFACGRGDG